MNKNDNDEKENVERNKNEMSGSGAKLISCFFEVLMDIS